jgi:hypothetical protein
MKGKNYLVTWMYSPSAEQNIVHLQTGKSNLQATQNLYWRCVFCLFESSHRNNNGAFEHVLYVNKMPPETIDGISTASLIKTFKINVHVIDERSLPPKGYYKAWSSQFLLIDMLRQMKEFVTADDRVVILDSDVIFTKPVQPDFFNDLDKYNSLLYTIDYPSHRPVNGLSLDELRNMVGEFSGQNTDSLYCEGGELISFKGVILSELLDAVTNGYRWALGRFEKGLPKFNTEEHLFSYAYWKVGLRPFTGNKYIKRMWTDLSSAVNLEAGDEHRMLWHLPAEKKHGFIRYFRLMGKNGNSLAGFEQSLPTLFRVKPTMKDRFVMMARIPLKKTYKLLKAI